MHTELKKDERRRKNRITVKARFARIRLTTLINKFSRNAGMTRPRDTSRVSDDPQEGEPDDQDGRYDARRSGDARRHATFDWAACAKN